MSNSNTLYIIDGHALIYAAFYAPIGSNLTSPTGEPTKATYIFTTMILKLLRERKPDLLTVTMDSKGPCFRHQLYKDYKANRPPMPDELASQIRRIDEILAAMKIPVLREDGYEADDLIAAVTGQARSQGYNVCICSKDKDLEQLLADAVVMYDPASGSERDVAGLMQKKGITPEQVVDVLALVGDTSDNVPGVPDVGPKTALQWIQKYGSLDRVLAHRDDIKGKRGQSLRDNTDQLKLAKKLVTLKSDVPLQLDWQAMALKGLDRGVLEQLFRQLGFTRLVKQLDDICQELGDTTAQAPSSPGTSAADSADSATVGAAADKTPAEPPAKAHYHLIDTEADFKTFLKALEQQGVFALDTETTSTNPVAADLVGMSFAWEVGEAYYLPLRVPLGQACLDRATTLERLRPILEDPDIGKVGQNIKYDMVVLRRAGLYVAGVSFDTMVASYILSSHRTRHNLDSMALDYLGHETIKLESLIGRGKNQLTFDMVDTHLAADYAAEDADITWRLKNYLDQMFQDESLRRLFDEVEMPLVNVLAGMEYEGIALDVHCLNKLSGQLADRMGELVEQIHREAGHDFNVDSPKQLSVVLFEELGLEAVKKTKSGLSTDQEVLEALQWVHPVPRLMLEYRQLSKLKNTYVDKLPSMIQPDTGRVHGSFNQTVAATGRLSSSEPNLQNIPIRTPLGQEIRRAFVAGGADKVLLAADYSQIELRLLAHFSRDEALLAAFASGQDIHRFVASQVYGVAPEEVDASQRGKAKGVNFGIIYGQSAFGLSRSIGISVGEAQQFIDDYFARYPRIREFMDGVIEQAKKESLVRTILGRRRSITDLNSRNVSRRRLAERMAVNTVVQGSAADLIKVAMINLHRRIQREHLDLKLLLQVHDELVLEAPRAQVEACSEVVREEMTTAMDLAVPIEVQSSWGDNWLVCKG